MEGEANYRTLIKELWAMLNTFTVDTLNFVNRGLSHLKIPDA